VDQLYVDPDVDGSGVARKLYDTAEREALNRGVAVLTATASLRAIPAFRCFGFVERARVQRTFNGATFEVAQMVKDLGASASLPHWDRRTGQSVGSDDAVAPDGVSECARPCEVLLDGTFIGALPSSCPGR
jgi:GNAT superfamily N-acetyltransferase